MTFSDLGLIQPILKALNNEGYTQPTPIQEQSIPILLKGKDLLGCAQTGTGKTAAFAIPIIQLLLDNQDQDRRQRRIRTLVVTPTRELAIQIGESFSAYGRYTNLRTTVIFGGVGQKKQTDILDRGVDILVATPGRLLDLISQGYISLRNVEFSVLDEADQMLDMGFIHDIRKIIAKLPVKRQSLFFSATMPKNIVELSRQMLGDFERVTVKPEQATAERVEQGVYFVTKKNKPNLLKHLLLEKNAEAVLVFGRTKHGCDKVVRLLDKANIKAAAIHGNKSQNARQRALGAFKDGDLHVLVATDIAARGIDVAELSLVINYDLPNVPETYVHRIGRTGRASASGEALSFCNGEERAYLKDIQKLIRQTIPVIEEHPFVDDGTEVFEQHKNPPSRHNSRGRGSNSGNRNHRSGGNNKFKPRARKSPTIGRN
ncbi:MAG: ATP-dependent RNA helicase RhlE [Saprospiraceae bacterium]|jgi:ATP-dependent RNA helicase RhlE